MKLEQHEAGSALWAKLSEHLQQRLDLSRRRNDGALDPIETATLRGEIKTLKYLLALADPEPVTVVSDDE